MLTLTLMTIHYTVSDGIIVWVLLRVGLYRVIEYSILGRVLEQ